jgi:hypothetical protein
MLLPLLLLLMSTGKWQDDTKEVLAQINKDYQADVYVPPQKRTSKSVVGLPRATRVNEAVNLDLVISMKDKPRLLMVDWQSRQIIDIVMPNKECESGIKAIIKHNMMKANPVVSRKEALLWYWIVKNALQTAEGCSSYQLMFGRNPRLPALVDDYPPAIVKKPKRQSLAEMLAGQEAAGKVFREVQTDKAIREAPRQNMRVQGRRMKMGEPLMTTSPLSRSATRSTTADMKTAFLLEQNSPS